MKQDLKLNFGSIDEIIGELYRFMRILEEMQQSVDKIETALQQEEGQAIEALINQKERVTQNINWYKEQINDLYEILRDYSGQMQSHIRPLQFHGMMRVDRNDIYWNLKQIEQTIPDRLNVVANADYISSIEPTSAMLEEFSYERNYNRSRLSEMEDSVRQLRSRLLQKTHEMNILFNNKVVYFEDADDDYKRRAKELYNKYSHFGEWLWDGATTIWDVISGTLAGAFDAFKDFVVGLFSLVGGILYYLASGLVILVTSPFGIEVEWAQTYFNQVNGTFAALFHDPNLLIEGIFQGAADTFDEKGIFYCTGYVVTDWYLIDKGLDKLGKLGKTDEITDVGKIVDDIDDFLKQGLTLEETIEKMRLSEKYGPVGIEHILNGWIKKNGEVGGGHIENLLGEGIKIIERIPEPPISGQPYTVIMETAGGKITDGKTMFPKDWSVEMIDEAIEFVYKEGTYVEKGNLKTGNYNGMEIMIYLNEQGKINSAFPIID